MSGMVKCVRCQCFVREDECQHDSCPENKFEWWICEPCQQANKEEADAMWLQVKKRIEQAEEADKQKPITFDL